MALVGAALTVACGARPGSNVSDEGQTGATGQTAETGVTAETAVRGSMERHRSASVLSAGMAASGPGYERALRAGELLAASAQAHGPVSGTDGARGALQLEYTGSLRIAGHYARPGQVKEYQLGGVYGYGGPEGAVMHEGWMRATAEDAPRSTRVVVRGDRAVKRDYGRTELVEVAPAEMATTAAELRWLLPQAIIHDAAAHAHAARWLGREWSGDALLDTVGYADDQGRYWTVYLDAETHLLARVERLVAHPLHGDAMEWYRFEGYRRVAGVLLPTRRSEQRLEDWSSWTREIEYADVSLAAASAEQFALPPLERSEPVVKHEQVLALGGGVYLLELPEENCKVLFMAFSDHIIVMEAPLSSAAGDRILRAIRATVPGKSVRYLIMSHHHPHYIGGSRPFVHAGVRLVTTPGNRDWLAALAEQPRQLAPDALARAPRPPVLEVVSGARVFTDGAQRLEVYDVGARSQHTDEYLVFYIPALELLFQGDLGWLPANAAEVTADRDFVRKRARRVLAIIDELHLEVSKIVQSWPLEGQHVVATRADLEAWSRDSVSPRSEP